MSLIRRADVVKSEVRECKLMRDAVISSSWKTARLMMSYFSMSDS